MKTVNILLVEDSEGDILLTLDALKDSKVINNVKVLRDGEAAITFFADEQPESDAIDLVLLDVNLPRKSGHEVLKYMKSTDHTRHIPVIMLTTSSSDTDIMASYDNFVNCYITKPFESNDFMAAVSKIESFWFQIVALPKNKHGKRS